MGCVELMVCTTVWRFISSLLDRGRRGILAVIETRREYARLLPGDEADMVGSNPLAERLYRVSHTVIYNSAYGYHTLTNFNTVPTILRN